MYHWLVVGFRLEFVFMLVISSFMVQRSEPAVLGITLGNNAHVL